MSRRDPAVRHIEPSDLPWMAELMEDRRHRYEAFSPVFWRPAAGMRDLHAAFMGSVVERPGTTALRTDHGFIITTPRDGRGRRPTRRSRALGCRRAS